MVATLGNFSTKLLTGNPTGISRVHGVAQVHQLGSRAVFLMPLFHPAAALRTPRWWRRCARDFAKLHGLLAQPLPDGVSAVDAVVAGPATARADAEAEQLDLFG